MADWWRADVECASRICRLERTGHLSLDDSEAAFDRHRQLRERWHEIQPVERVKELGCEATARAPADRRPRVATGGCVGWL